MQNGSYNTYTSTLASSSSSRSFSLVGCHIGISKYLTIKGQTTLSRTKNKKYLPPSEIRNDLKCKTEAIAFEMQNGSYKTYTSTLASSNSSRAFSLVGCYIGISKYLTRKGQTTLSRTKSKKKVFSQVACKKTIQKNNHNINCTQNQLRLMSQGI